MITLTGVPVYYIFVKRRNKSQRHGSMFSKYESIIYFSSSICVFDEDVLGISIIVINIYTLKNIYHILILCTVMKILYLIIFFITSKIQFLGILRTSLECAAVLHCWLVK